MDTWTHLLHDRAPAPPAAPRRTEPAWPGARTAATMVAFVATVLVLLITSQSSGSTMQPRLSSAEDDSLSLPPAGMIIDDEGPAASAM